MKKDVGRSKPDNQKVKVKKGTTNSKEQTFGKKRQDKKKTFR